MFFLKDGWSSKPRFQAIRAVLFLFLVHHCQGQSQVIGPSQPIVAFLGDDVMLPCHLEPAVDTSGMTVEWTRPDLNPRFVHVWRDGVELETKKHPSYEGRTLLSIDKLKHGDISLKLDKVKLTDEGTYRCFIPTLNRESSVKLVVGAVSSLIISIRTERLGTENDEDINRLVLQCESKGWYPEPEVSWLDGEGNIFSAGPTETVRGPDGLYNVSSRVTVEKRHNNTLSCRVQQKDTKQTRETQIHVPDDVLSPPCSYTAHITIISLTLVVVVILGVFVAWKWKQRPKRDNFTSGDHTELHPLKEEERETLQVNDLNEKKENLDLELKKLEEECKEVEVALNFLTDHKTAVEEQIGDLILQRINRQEDQSQCQAEQNNTKYTEEKQNENKCLDTNTNLDTEINELQKKINDTDAILTAIFCGICIVKDKKTVLDDLKKQINKQLLEIKEQRDGIQTDISPDQTDTDAVKKFSTAAEMKTG